MGIGSHQLTCPNQTPNTAEGSQTRFFAIGDPEFISGVRLRGITSIVKRETTQTAS
jgi:hypothetical protein